MCPLSRCDTPLSSNPATAHRHTPLWAAKQASTPAIPFSVPPITLDFSSSSADSEPDTPLSEFEPRADSDTSRPFSIFPLTLTSLETRRKGRKKKRKKSVDLSGLYRVCAPCPPPARRRACLRAPSVILVGGKSSSCPSSSPSAKLCSTWFSPAAGGELLVIVSLLLSRAAKPAADRHLLTPPLTLCSRAAEHVSSRTHPSPYPLTAKSRLACPLKDYLLLLVPSLSQLRWR
jgi:hypothetical protein